MAVPALKEITLTNSLTVEKNISGSAVWTYDRLRVISAECVDYKVVSNQLVADPSITFQAALYSSSDVDAPVILLRGDILQKGNDLRLTNWTRSKDYDFLTLGAAGQELTKTWVRQLVNLVTEGLVTADMAVGTSS